MAPYRANRGNKDNVDTNVVKNTSGCVTYIIGTDDVEGAEGYVLCEIRALWEGLAEMLIFVMCMGRFS